MDIIGKNKIGLRLFLSVSVIFLAYTLLFVGYSKLRERQYKNELAGVRVTIIDSKGHVRMDTEQQPAAMGNHLQRKEVQQALKEGYGFDISRTSQTNGERYFYSATYFPEAELIVRTAIPYPSDHDKLLIPGTHYVWVSLVIFALLAVVLYQYSQRFGRLVDNTIDEKRKQVTHNTAHELKTPASSIQGYLETLIANPDLPAEQRQYFLERCYSQSTRMNALLKDISTLNRLDEKGKHTAHFENLDLAQLIRETVNDSLLRAQEKHITIQTSIPDSIPMQGDSELLYSVFRNLLDNAIAYSGGSVVNITSETSRKAGMLGFCVSDDGVGVGEEHLPYLCERFYRVDKGRSRNQGGTGLGLAIVKNAILLHGGSIICSATTPHGLTIHFTLRQHQ